MKPMIFSVDEAWEQLHKSGFVHSCRTRPKEVGDKVWIRRTRTGPKVAEAVVTSCSYEILEPWYLNKWRKHGFEDVNEWIAEIREQHGKIYRAYIIELELLAGPEELGVEVSDRDD